MLTNRTIMSNIPTVNLKVELGSVKVEFGGSEAFLQKEVPKFIESVRKVQATAAAPLVAVLDEQIGSAKIEQEDLAKAIDTLKNDLDSLSELGEMESLRLQMAMDRMSKMMSTLSNLLKKISDTSSQITQNLK